jgi:hypothetical protein
VYCVSVVTCYALLIYTIDDILNANDKLLNIADKVEVYILWLKVVKSAHIDSPPALIVFALDIDYYALVNVISRRLNCLSLEIDFT